MPNLYEKASLVRTLAGMYLDDAARYERVGMLFKASHFYQQHDRFMVAARRLQAGADARALPLSWETRNSQIKRASWVS